MSAYRSSPAPLRARLLAGCALAAAAAASQAQAQRAFQATPTGTINASVSQATGRDTVTITGPQALIDWTPTDNGAGGGPINILAAGDELRFQANASSVPKYTVLNRINPADPSRAVRIDGLVNSLVDTGYGISDGSIWFYTPGGIILGSNARFDVGSLVLTTNAPQIGDLDTEGLFVGQDGNATAGTIAFRGSPDSKSFVTVEAGAKINATGSYVALVAPRVSQRGAITVNGSAALIAAESADVTIPMSGNLFDIAVFSGSSVDTPGEVTLEHKGSTQITDPQATGQARNIYMVAVPKNDAITMLVSGTAGYEPASQVFAQQGLVVLAAARDVAITSDGGVTTVTPGVLQGGNITVAGANLHTRPDLQDGGRTEIYAGALTVEASTSSTKVGGDLFTFTTGTQITVGGGQSVDVRGDGTFGAFTADVGPGGLLSFGGDVNVAATFGGGSGAPLPVTVDPIDIDVDGGQLIVGGTMSLTSRAFGSTGVTPGEATGGAISVAVRNEGLLDIGGGLNAQSEGFGGESGYGAAAAGFGGGIQLAVTNGATLQAGSIDLYSHGQGGDGDVAAAGQGGLASMTVTGGSVEVGYGVTMRSIGGGGGSNASGGKGGAGTGGTVTLAVAGGGSLDAGGAVSLEARGQGGLELGYGSVSGGAGTGGTASVDASAGGIITAQSMAVAVTGFGADGERGGGAGTGGGATLTLAGGTIDVGTLAFNVQGAGGLGRFASGANGGAGIGGTLDLTAGTGTLAFDQLQIDAQGQGGTSFTAMGGAGAGGVIKVGLTGTTLSGGNAVSIDASGGGGEGAGSGTGGRITFTAVQTDLTSTGSINLTARGFGDFGSDGGGSGTGGKIDVLADKATIAAADIFANASGAGEAAFSTGTAGDGVGGALSFTAQAGGMLKGLSQLRADGRSGDGLSDAAAGAATGGSVFLNASGGTIDSTGRTLEIFAEGIGGTAETDGTPQLARGGTVDIGVSAGGQLLVTSLEASANGYFNDMGDGPQLNHGGTGVGGTARVAISGGSIAGELIELSASGQGAVSGSGGEGGTGYQGRAEFVASGGTVQLDTLMVNALATGGVGYRQDSEIDIDAGAGGAAGIGESPFVGQAGAFADVTGGTFEVNDTILDGSSLGGRGGQGEQFSITPAPREGGAAVGGVAAFTSSGSAAVTISSLVVRADGTGGEGGALFLGEGSFSNSLAGAGGAGTGGSASISLGGSGGLQLFSVFASAFGTGGVGGNICSLFCGSVTGGGSGGDGGSATGGGANILVNETVGEFAFLSARADATGGDGGAGPSGGAGGSALGGSATIAVAAGDSFFSTLEASAEATGGAGADGLGGDGGAGGSAAGFNASITIGADARVTSGDLRLSSAGFGGQGGRGADGSSAAFNGGDGGDGTGGTAALNVTGGTLILPGGSEAPPATLIASGSAGDGGDGGDAAEGSAGSGGDGGDAFGGTAAITSDDGAVDLFFTSMEADATAGARGTAGSGFEGVDGTAGGAEGGSIRIDADQSGAPGNRALLGYARLSANGGVRFEEFALANAGDIRISARGTNPAGALGFEAIEAEARGFFPSNKAANGIAITGDGSPITVLDFVDAVATGSIDLSFTGDSGLRAGLDVTLRAGDGIAITHAGQAVGGSAASLSGRDVELHAGGSVIAAAASRIDAGRDLEVLASSGSAQLGSGTVGGSVYVEAFADAILADGAQLIADRSVEIVSGDDIIIGTGALLRAANNPPAETGYGATDPLQQATQLRLYAGAIESEIIPGNVASILLRGDVQSPGRTMQLEAQAIQAADGTTLSGGNLYVRKIGSTPANPADDFGQLAAPCLEGSLCLANAVFSGIVEIGGSGFGPTNLRISGDLSGTTVFAGATGTVRLGRDGFASSITVSDRLTIDARDGDLIGSGTTTLTGGTGLTSLYAGGDLSAAGLDITAPGGFDLVSGGDVVLGQVTAPQIRTLSQSLSVLNPNGVTAAGLIDLGGVTTSADLLLDSAVGVTIGKAELLTGKALTINSAGMATIGDAVAGEIAVNATGTITADTLTALSGDIALQSGQGNITLAALSTPGQAALRADLGTIIVSTDASAQGGIDALAQGVALTGANGLNVNAAKATAGDVVLTTTAGELKAGNSAASGAITLASQGGISFASLSAGTGIAAAAEGAITGGTASAIGAPASFSGNGGVSLDTLIAQSVDLEAASGAIKVATVSAPGGVTASGASIDLTGSGELRILLAEATSGDVALRTAGGALMADRIAASGGVTADAKSITVDRLAAGGAAKLTATAGAVTVATDAAVAGGISASGQVVTLTSLSGLDVTQATATDGGVTLASGGPVSFGAISGKSLTVTAASGSITGTSATASNGADILAQTGSVTIDVLTVTGAGETSVEGAAGVTLKAVQSAGLVKLASSGGAVTAAAIGPSVSFEAAGTSVALTSAGDLDVARASATAGDLSLSGAGAVSFGELAAAGSLAITAQDDVTGGSATAASIAVTTPGAVKADDLIATAGPLSIIGDQGVTLRTAQSAGAATLKTVTGALTVTSDISAAEGLILRAPSIDLTAQNGLKVIEAVTTAGDLRLTAAAGDLTAGTLSSSGAVALTALGGRIDVTEDLSAAGPIQAAAQAMSLTAVNDLVIAQAQATGGDIVLASKAGALSIGQADATGGLFASTPGLLTLTGNAAGATIAFTSKDIAIGSGAQLGSKTQTTALTLTSTADRMFIGEATGTGYRLDGTELARLASKGDISLVSAPANRQDVAYSLVDPNGTNIVVGALTFDGAQLGANGTLRIASPQSIGFIGNSQFKNFTDGQTVTIAAAGDISLAAETGLVTVKDSAGALAGTLRLEAQQVHAMSTATRTNIAGLELSEVRQRLGTNDQVNNQGGYFQAGRIVVRIGRLLLIQNSGENGDDPALRRGLTANSLTIFSGEGAPAQIVLNGQVNGATGAALRENVTLTGSFDNGSALNGCLLSNAVCGSAPPPPEPSFDAAPVISSARDQIEDEADEDEKEEALQASQTRPEPIIQFMSVPSSRFDPLIDEPVTGAGNEDFWETPSIPTPGRNP